MDRRSFIKAAAYGAAAVGLVAETAAAEVFYPTGVDPKLFETINRVKDPAKKTPLEMTHVPFIAAPAKVKAGEVFEVGISVGEKPHVMGPTHWIEYIELSIGNEPAGRADFQSKGYVQPRATFHVVLTKESAPNGKVTLLVHQRCNLHGYWEGSATVEVE